MFTCTAHRGRCPRAWSVVIVMRGGLYEGHTMHLCARHWRRYSARMLAAGWVVADRAERT